MDTLPKGIQEKDTTIPVQAIEYINKLFELEKNLEVLSSEGRKEQRLIQEKPVLEAFWSWAEKASVGILPKSKLGAAFTYAFNQKEGLMNYLLDGNCAISNNLAENNSIRPFTIGRKNWLFSGSPKGVKAILYTLIESAKANELDGYEYLKYLRTEMPNNAHLEHPEILDNYLPWSAELPEECRLNHKYRKCFNK